MKKIYLILTACLVLGACKRVTVDFEISPVSPRAGETVIFSNYSSGGQDWQWTFGDGATSMLKNPTHVYKKPGEYRVVLKVDKKSSQTATKLITIYDTVPTFMVTDSFYVIYKDYTFTALVYNPYNYKLKYLWYQPSETGEEPYYILNDTTAESNKVSLYFTHPMDTAQLGLRIVMNGDTFEIEKGFKIKDRETVSLLFRTGEGDYRQRIFGSRAEEFTPGDEDATLALDVEQDTFQIYNDYGFFLSDMKSVFPELEGFHIANRKFYYRANGLWVANIDGSYPVQIDSLPCPAMTLDMTSDRIYWANKEGIWYMPFIGSDNNRFISRPQLLNNVGDVRQIAFDPVPRHSSKIIQSNE